jgi:hypothetical protein
MKKILIVILSFLSLNQKSAAASSSNDPNLKRAKPWCAAASEWGDVNSFLRCRIIAKARPESGLWRKLSACPAVIERLNAYNLPVTTRLVWQRAINLEKISTFKAGTPQHDEALASILRDDQEWRSSNLGVEEDEFGQFDLTLSYAWLGNVAGLKRIIESLASGDEREASLYRARLLAINHDRLAAASYLHVSLGKPNQEQINVWNAIQAIKRGNLPMAAMFLNLSSPKDLSKKLLEQGSLPYTICLPAFAKLITMGTPGLGCSKKEICTSTFWSSAAPF